METRPTEVTPALIVSIVFLSLGDQRLTSQPVVLGSCQETWTLKLCAPVKVGKSLSMGVEARGTSRPAASKAWKLYASIPRFSSLIVPGL